MRVINNHDKCVLLYMSFTFGPYSIIQMNKHGSRVVKSLQYFHTQSTVFNCVTIKKKCQHKLNQVQLTMLNSSSTTTDLFHNNLLQLQKFNFTAFKTCIIHGKRPIIQRQNYFKSSQSQFSVNCLLCNFPVFQSWRLKNT